MKRTVSFFKRVAKLSEKYFVKMSDFTVISKLNEQPNSNGIFSISLFGNVEDKKIYKKYVEPILYNAKIIDTICPGWCIRVYLSSLIPNYIVDELVKHNCEVYIMKEDENNKFSGTLWRFLCASETKPFIICDSDMKFDENTYDHSSIKKKDIDEWLNSDKTFFRRRLGLINNFIPISAGMWGGKPTKEGKPPIPKIKKQMEKYKHDWFGTDECFLSKELYNDFKKSNYTVTNSIENNFQLTIYLIILLLVILFFTIKKK
jgi:hypothetical protein